jgi:hypothetical protein
LSTLNPTKQAVPFSALSATHCPAALQVWLQSESPQGYFCKLAMPSSDIGTHTRFGAVLRGSKSQSP